MAIPNPSTPLRSRGMRDLPPDDMRAFRRVTDAFRAAANHWGYEEIRTPTIETYSLFTAAGGLTPQMLSRVYSFLDWDGWSGERVVLRPDSTIPVARAAAEAGLLLPARLFYVQQVFRFSADADREDWQCGVEFLGAPELVGDLEAVSIACETMEALGTRPVVRLAHVGVVRALVALLEARGHGDQRALLDLVAEHGLGALRPSVNGDARLGAFIEVAAAEHAGLPLLENIRAIAGDALPDASPAIEELLRLGVALAESGRTVAVDLGMPRDFEYYTGLVFEFAAEGERWGGGGRYVAGGPLMASSSCGFALDAGNLARQFAAATPRREPVAVVPARPSDITRALQVARTLHQAGITAVLGEARDARLAVHAGADGLAVDTPDGQRTPGSPDELIALLVQYK